MNSIKNELQDSIGLASHSKPKFERLAQAVWIGGLVGPLPLVLSPILADLERIQTWPVYVFGILIWCVAVLALVAMIFSRWNRVTRFSGTWASRTLVVLGIACYCVSAFTGSLWVAIAGWGLHCGAWLATHASSKDTDYGKLLIHWPALCMLLQLPGFIETKLVLAYKQLLSAVTASSFDALGIPFRNDNLAFEFAQTKLSIDDVLVNSQPIAWMLLVSCMIVAWLRRPLALLPVYLAVAIFWTVGTHLVQLAIIAFARQKYAFEFSSGWLSILLTTTTLVMFVGLFLSSDRLLQILFMPVPLEDSLRRPLNPLNHGWNRLLLPLAIDQRARK